MYGLPQDFDASAFVGHKLDNVTFTENSVHFAFDGEVTVSLYSSFSHRRSHNTVHQTVPVHSSNVMSLLGKVVRLAEGRPDGTLTLQFDGGEALILLDDSKQYESYLLRFGDREIVV